jgi:hypothetical protein
MSSTPNSPLLTGGAEKAFREAFDRLKKGKPERLSKNANISQNNIAKEAGCDPSALRKTRFPSLIAEIQRWIAENPADSPPSPRQSMLAQRRRNLSLKHKLEILTAQRDHALSLLVDADERIFELTLEKSELKAKLPKSSFTHPLKRS